MPRTAAPPGRTPPLLHSARRRLDAVRPRPGAPTWRHRRGPDARSAGGPAAEPRRHGEPLVLLVDDEQPIRTICRVNLEIAGIAVDEAADGGEAIARVRERQPSLVLLDVMMPRVDGWTVAERLAADPRTRELPVVFLSARAGAEDRRRAHELGAVGYVVKPFDPLELGTTVTTVLERLRRGEREQLRREVLARE